MSKSQSHNPLIKFSPGELVVHKKYGYRGVIIEVDDGYDGTDDDHEQGSNEEHEKDQPWYRVLVDGSDYITYVAEVVLDSDPSLEPINHPQLTEVFHKFEDGKYLRQLH